MLFLFLIILCDCYYQLLIVTLVNYSLSWFPRFSLFFFSFSLFFLSSSFSYLSYSQFFFFCEMVFFFLFLSFFLSQLQYLNQPSPSLPSRNLPIRDRTKLFFFVHIFSSNSFSWTLSFSFFHLFIHSELPRHFFLGLIEQKNFEVLLL